jgi:hypothetical protein
MVIVVKKFEFDAYGWLFVDKLGDGGLLQYCPLSTSGEVDTHCGLQCPLCSGPYVNPVTGRRAVALCQDRILEESDDETDDRN